jgi:hypothetical protein
MTKHRWNYLGDTDLRYGGYFWKEDDAEDYVLCVDVIPCSDAGGADNKFVIEWGNIYLPIDDAAKLKSALASCGLTPETATRADIVDAFKFYHGLDDRMSRCVQIGKAEDENPNGWNPETDIQLRSNAKLKNFVKREFLS